MCVNNQLRKALLIYVAKVRIISINYLHGVIYEVCNQCCIRQSCRSVLTEVGQNHSHGLNSH